jgi:hypothetical protein
MTLICYPTSAIEPVSFFVLFVLAMASGGLLGWRARGG